MNLNAKNLTRTQSFAPFEEVVLLFFNFRGSEVVMSIPGRLSRISQQSWPRICQYSWQTQVQVLSVNGQGFLRILSRLPSQHPSW